jgi:MFS family permease
MAGLSAMNYFDRSILAIAAPRLVSTLHIGEVSMGMAFSAFLLGYTLLLTPGGWLADQAGPRRVLAIACGAWALLTAATALAGAAPRFAIPPLAALIAIRFLFGASSAPLYPGCSRLAVTTIPAHRVTAVQALVVSCSAVGSAAAPFAFTRLMEGLGWQAAFCAAGLVTAGVALAWRAATHRLSDSAPVARSDAAGISRAVLANRSLLWLSAKYFCNNYIEYNFF